MLETSKRLAADRGDLAFCHDIEGDNIRKTASLHILHNDPELSTAQEAVDEVDNVGMRALLHDQDLIDNQVLLGLLFEIHLLDSDQTAGATLVSGIDTSRSTLTNLCEAAVNLTRVAFRADPLERRNDVHTAALTLLSLPALGTGASSHGASTIRSRNLAWLCVGAWQGLLAWHALLDAGRPAHLPLHRCLGLVHGLLLLMLEQPLLIGHLIRHR